MKLGGTSSKVWTEGVYAKTKLQSLLQNWLDSKIQTIAKDEGAAKLFKTDGSHKETICKDRYLAGFADIINRNMSTLTSDKVVFLFSHSDGIGAFLKSVGSAEKIEDLEYCGTVAVEIHKQGDSWTPSKITVVKN